MTASELIIVIHQVLTLWGCYIPLAILILAILGLVVCNILKFTVGE